ncbi:MAG: nucleotidyltransferase domain-containing protein [Nitrospirae bacterium]|nr:nucleotidyltransferase domain-containing protein [Nitrospirota bacterium]
MVKTGQEIEEIIKQYTSKLADLGMEVERVILFGSYAKGHPREDSDIDLIVVSKDFEKMNIRERLEILGIASARIMQPIQAKGYTPQEMGSKEKDSFLAEVLENSKIAA